MDKIKFLYHDPQRGVVGGDSMSVYIGDGEYVVHRTDEIEFQPYLEEDEVWLWVDPRVPSLVEGRVRLRGKMTLLRFHSARGSGWWLVEEWAFSPDYQSMVVRKRTLI